MKRLVRLAFIQLVTVSLLNISIVYGKSVEESQVEIQALSAQISSLRAQLECLKIADNALTVRLACSQPIQTLLPPSATRIPFLRIQLAAPKCSDAIVSSLTVQGLGNGLLALDSIMLLNEEGIQYGSVKKLSNKNKQAIFDLPISIKAGETLTLVIAGNRLNYRQGLGGLNVSLAVVDIIASSGVNASLPLYGAIHTINETLVIGSFIVSQDVFFDKVESMSEARVNRGICVLSPMKIRAGSQERLYLKSIRWRRSGSVGNEDMKNLRTVVVDSGDDGVVLDGYGVFASSDDMYYTTIFPRGGILIDKGLSITLYLCGRFISGAGGVVDFDVVEPTDIYLVGETYGYGISTSRAAKGMLLDGLPVSIIGKRE